MTQPRREVLQKLTPVLTKRWLSPDAWKMDVYEQLDGYAALQKALDLHPDDLIQLIKDSGLRGRGGAGFPTGLKWGFIPQGDGKPHYLVINADEGEPGTCKDLPLMTYDPHSLVEGAIIASYAIRASRAFIYIRGEAVHAARRLRHAVKEAAGWMLEKVSRLRLNPALTGSAELTRLMETEALSLGIEGKLAMWLALKEAAAADPRLAGTDYDRLIERARGQRGALEPHRLAAAAAALSA